MKTSNKKKSEIVLSIETTGGGGSVALLADGSVLEEWRGSREVSKAEDVLDEISKILQNREIEKKQISAVVVSNEDNSTGGKIGLAIGRGLVKSLNCQLIRTSVLESIISEYRYEIDAECLAAASVGKNQFKRQYFCKEKDDQFRAVSDVEVLPAKQFVEETENYNGKIILAVDGEIPEASDERKNPNLLIGNNPSVIFCNQNLAKLNGLAAHREIYL